MEHLGKTRFACLCAEHELAALRDRVCTAERPRSCVVELPDQRKVVFDPIIGEWLNQQDRAIGGTVLGGIARCGYGIAQVVQAVEETDQPVVPGGVLYSAGY